MPEREKQITVSTHEQAFEVLGVPSDSDWKQVRHAYSAALKRLHPDTGGAGDGEQLTRVVEAYRFLSGDFGQEGCCERPTLFALGELALHAETARERAFACSRLASLGRKSAGAYLQRALFDTEEIVAVAAAKGIAKIRSLAAAESLSAVFDRAGEDLRAVIVDTACTIGTYRCFRDLAVKALEDGNPRWRSDALRLYLGIMREERTRNERTA